MSVAEAAASIGITRAALLDRARRRGFPKRKTGRCFCVPVVKFSAMWDAGVQPSQLRARYGTPFLSTLTETARRLGLRKFARGGKRITIDDYFQIKLGREMAECAVRERAMARSA
ncbi:hypothetical protein [Falsirhodobacter halotolerans]|uniref:hypothetical protein n=1 Tax=Falsirhodobacter halotolerans TaxID=1146892 RepID=UPI001FD62179|nr:hypothetical protein [Falsirhodobacter halotolerans]MCJ8139498.1 hypothetical protein [Falsirhodobacter halotolerans]